MHLFFVFVVSLEVGLGISNDYEDPSFTTATTATSSTGTATSTGATGNGQSAPHREGDEYSTTFISIRQSRVNDSLDQIDVTPPLKSHDYSNVDMPGPVERPPVVVKKPPPANPSPFRHGQRSSPIGNFPSSSEEVPHDNHHAPPGGHPPPRLGGVTKSPSSRESYDPPMALKATKPPVKKKPTATSRTRPGVYDNPEEVIAATKRKVKPAKPSRENLIKETAPAYNFPDEGVYNTAEGVYDDGVPGKVREGGVASMVPPSPKFDDGIYMDSNGGNPRKSGLENMCELLV